MQKSLVAKHNIMMMPHLQGRQIKPIYLMRKKRRQKPTRRDLKTLRKHHSIKYVFQKLKKMEQNDGINNNDPKEQRFEDTCRTEKKKERCDHLFELFQEDAV